MRAEMTLLSSPQPWSTGQQDKELVYITARLHAAFIAHVSFNGRKNGSVDPIVHIYQNGLQQFLVDHVLPQF